VEAVKRSLYASDKAAHPRYPLRKPNLEKDSTFKMMPISAKRFSKKKFFASELGVDIRVERSFKESIILQLPAYLPQFKREIGMFDLPAPRLDDDILSQIGSEGIFTPDEAVAIFGSLIMKQPEGENGILANATRKNLIYVRLENKDLVSVGIWFSRSGRECWWYFFVDHLHEDSFKKRGSRIFVK